MSYNTGSSGNGTGVKIITSEVVPYDSPLAPHNIIDPNITFMNDAVTENPRSNHVTFYVLVALGSLILIAGISASVIFILKKSRLDKLRHHLMPLYNFDPADEEGDWESELLEEDKDQQMALHITSFAPYMPTPSPTDGPKLKFTVEQMEV